VALFVLSALKKGPGSVNGRRPRWLGRCRGRGLINVANTDFIFTVITNPEDKNFDLEAFLTMAAAESKK